jgi:hypothetical protein
MIIEDCFGNSFLREILKNPIANNNKNHLALLDNNPAIAHNI